MPRLALVEKLDLVWFVCSGLYAVSCWARLSGSHSAAREDGAVEQNRLCLPGVVIFVFCVFVFVNMFPCPCQSFDSCPVSCLLRSCRESTTTLWCRTTSQPEPRGESCLRGKAAGLQYVCHLSFLLPSSSSSIDCLLSFPSGTSLMFDGWSANETATCLLAWQRSTTPNLRSVATSGQDRPAAQDLCRW